MAASTRAITPTHTGNFATTTVAPDTPTSISSNPPATAAKVSKESPRTQLTPIVANTSLRGSESPKSPRTVLSPTYFPRELSGAAAMAEQRQLREKQQQEQARQTSPNPGITAVQTLLDRGLSTSKDAPAAVTKMSDPLAKVAKAISIPDKSSNDPTQTSPISMSSFGSLDTTTAPTATAMEALAPPIVDNPPQSDIATPKASAHDAKAAPTPNESSGPRAYTFPPPLDQDPRSTPQRGMSLPVPYSHHGQQQATPQTRSPSISTGSGSSTKRHKCPYCSTDFTRHHNLKSHLLTHSQEKPYECPTCNARFRRLHDLKRHTKLHTGERPHTCPKCGRRFARGDALARHGKGAGGCAGRRSSFGAPGSTGDDIDDAEGMDGLEYSSQQVEEPEHMDEDEPGQSDRRRSEPSREVQHPGGGSASTYPPIQGASRVIGNNVRPMYPPPQAATNTTNTTASSIREQTGSNMPSAQNSGSSAPSGVHFQPQQPSVFGQPGMTESPKPLSPGQEHRGSLSEASRGLTGYTRSRGSSSVSLHPNANAPQLPSLPGLNPAHAPSMLHQSMPAPGPHQGSGSNPGSHSSHGQSSGGSLREVLAGGPGPAGHDPWIAIRDLESRLVRMHEEYQSTFVRMSDEINHLRAQVRDLTGREPAPLPQQAR